MASLIPGNSLAGAVARVRGWLAAGLPNAPVLCLALAGALAGCGTPPPPPPPPTVLEITLSAAPDSNRNAGGQGTPITVRLYQLGSPAGFEGAEFYRLYRQDAATLGADMIKRDEYLLAPGSTRTITLRPPEPVRALGVFAAYRDYGNATWRAVEPVPANKTTEVSITVGASGVAMASKPGAAPPPPRPQ